MLSLIRLLCVSCMWVGGGERYRGGSVLWPLCEVGLLVLPKLWSEGKRKDKTRSGPVPTWRRLEWNLQKKKKKFLGSKDFWLLDSVFRLKLETGETAVDPEEKCAETKMGHCSGTVMLEALYLG